MQLTRQFINRQASRSRRGDTLIEVMLAIAIFSFVALLSISMMNIGVGNSEQSLELVTARNELNAQAEALRFIHSSYIAERSLPRCKDAPAGEKCQQFEGLWTDITANALNPPNPDDPNNPKNSTMPTELTACQEYYKKEDGQKSLLERNNAFVLNTRRISYLNNSSLSDAYNLNNAAYISINQAKYTDLFQPAPLNARIIYVKGTDNQAYTDEGENPSESSLDALSTSPREYRKIGRVEGLWITAIRENGGGDTSRYYDFYIQSCWYGPSALAPTSLDTVIRLYNPEGK